MTRPIATPSVAQVFAGMDPSSRVILMALRDLILQTADDELAVGEISEELRWGQPAYLTTAPKTGTTLRLGIGKTGKCAMFVHCQTTLISDFISTFPGLDETEGNRAVFFDDLSGIDTVRHGWFIHRALTYHL